MNERRKMIKKLLVSKIQAIEYMLFQTQQLRHKENFFNIIEYNKLILDERQFYIKLLNEYTGLYIKLQNTDFPINKI